MLLGKRISLGPIVPVDFPSLFCWANDLDAMRYDAAYRPMDFVTHTQWCENIGRDATAVVFAIRKLDEPSIIGYVRISNISPVHRSADFGIRIGTEANRGQGYGKEATALALDFCWKHLNLNRVQLIVFNHNTRATRAYEAAGFEREGLLRQAVFINGEWVDIVPMGILRPAVQAHGFEVLYSAPGVALAPAA